MRALAFVVALLLAFAPAAAWACAVCTGGGEESRAAFVVTTIGMSVLPLAMLGGLGWWIWRRMKAAEADSSASRDLAATPRNLV